MWLHFDYSGAKELIGLDLKFSFSSNPLKEALRFYELLRLVAKNFSKLKIKARKRATEIE